MQLSVNGRAVRSATKSGCYRYPLLLIEELIMKSGVITSIILFEQTFSIAGCQIYSTPWNSTVYEVYNAIESNGALLLVEFYIDGATLSRSGTQSASFLRVRFSNIQYYTEEWSTIGIVPTCKRIPSSLPSNTIRRLRRELIQRFIFITFKSLISSSYTGHAIIGSLLIPRIGTINADQPQERAILCLKGQNRYMYSSHCSLPSFVSDSLSESPSNLNRTVPMSDDDDSPAPGRRIFLVNRTDQLSTDGHNPRNVFHTVASQLTLAHHDLSPSLPPSTTAPLRRQLLLLSAHPYPSAISPFAGLGSPPFNLSRVVSFDKLHVFDIGIIRQYCDLVNTDIKDHTTCSLTRTMGILNDRYLSLPPFALLPAHVPFHTSLKDNQTAISGKIRRHTVPFLWHCVMGVTRHTPDTDPLIQTALQLDKVNNFLCNSAQLTYL